MQPEPVLLIDHGEAEIGERHALLHQGMGTHHEVDAAVGHAVDRALTVLGGDGARQEHVRHRGLSVVGRGRPVERLEQRGLPTGGGGRSGGGELEVRHSSHATEQVVHGSEVLARQHLGRGHDRRLVAGVDRHQRRVQCDERLAGADVTLQQDVHRVRPRHRRPDLAHRPSLGVGGLERDRLQQPVRERTVEVVGHPCALCFHTMLAEGHPQLQREQLVELQPLTGGVQRRFVGREVDVAQRPIV